MITLIIAIVIAYIIMGCIVGTIFDYYIPDENEITSGLVGIFWPIAIPLIIIIMICIKFCKFVRKIVTHFDEEGFHYYKGNLKSCCGKCKYIEYQNSHNEINKCELHNITRFSSQTAPCEKFKKNPFWRFTIRINKHEIQCNK